MAVTIYAAFCFPLFDRRTIQTLAALPYNKPWWMENTQLMQNVIACDLELIQIDAWIVFCSLKHIYNVFSCHVSGCRFCIGTASFDGVNQVS